MQVRKAKFRMIHLFCFRGFTIRSRQEENGTKLCWEGVLVAPSIKGFMCHLDSNLDSNLNSNLSCSAKDGRLQLKHGWGWRSWMIPLGWDTFVHLWYLTLGAGHYSGMANGQAGSGITLNTNPLVTLTHDCILAKLTYDRTLVTPTYYQLDAPEAKCLYANYFEELVKQCNFKCKLTSFKLSNLRQHMEGRMYVINVTPLASWSHKHIIDSMWPMTECLQWHAWK